MSARFRIRTSAGQEISFASVEVFAEFVRLGDLAPDDVVYDAETKEWASALTHPVVLQIQLEAEEAQEGAGEEVLAPEEARVESDSTESGSGDAGGSPLGDPTAPAIPMFGLDLAPAPEGLTPEQESAAFVAKMQAERASQVDPTEDERSLEFRMEKGSASVLDERPPATPTVRRTERPAVREERPVPREERPQWEPPPARVEREVPKQKKAPSPLWKYAPFVIILGVVAGAGVVFWPDLAPPAGQSSTPPPGSAPAVRPGPPPLIPDTPEALRTRARERFLTATQAALRELDPIPDVWLRGQYLAAPSDYPAVRAVWEEYLATIRDVRAAEGDRYRDAYVRALDDAQVPDSLRASRLAAATDAFGAAAPRRAAHYDRVEALANAALQGHDALVRAEGTIAYQPATGPAVSGDPVVEAVGRGPQAQAVLDGVLDLILSRMHGEGGPGQAANVREWVWVGFLGAVTN